MQLIFIEWSPWSASIECFKIMKENMETLDKDESPMKIAMLKWKGKVVLLTGMATRADGIILVQQKERTIMAAPSEHERETTFLEFSLLI